MANVLKSVFERGLSRLEASLDDPTWTFNGTAFACVPSTERRGTMLEVGGFTQIIELTLHVRQEEMPAGLTVDSTVVTVDSDYWTADSSTEDAKPVVGRKGAYRGRPYRVIAVREPAPGSHWEVDLASPHK